MDIPGTIPITPFGQVASSTPPTALNIPFLASGVQKISQDSFPRISRVRKLTNINCTLQITVHYFTTSADPSPIGATSHATPTFVLYKNNQPVFVSSAQIELATSSTGSANFVNSNSYGVFTDFVNPIIVSNSDSLGAQLFVAGFEPVISEQGPSFNFLYQISNVAVQTSDFSATSGLGPPITPNLLSYVETDV